MSDLLLSLSGYAWGMLHDIASLRRTPRVKPLLLTLSAAGHLFGLYRLMRYGPRWNPHPLLRWSCVLLAPLSFVGFFYSIMVEIPLRKAWLEEGHTDELVTTGTYALTRHPGVLWIAIAVLASAVATRSRRLLWSAPVIVAGDVVHVAFQERVVLPQVFGEAYADYQHETPFVVPTPRSATRFARTITRSEVARSQVRQEA